MVDVKVELAARAEETMAVVWLAEEIGAGPVVVVVLVMVMEVRMVVEQRAA